MLLICTNLLYGFRFPPSLFYFSLFLSSNIPFFFFLSLSPQFRSERPAGGQEPGANSIMRWLNIKANDASLSAELLIELRPLKKEEEMKEKRHLIEVCSLERENFDSIVAYPSPPPL